MRKRWIFLGLLVVGVIFLFCMIGKNEKKLSVKEEIFLLVQENEKELELLLPFFKNLSQGEVVIRDPSRKSEKWTYYLDYDNEALNQIMEKLPITSAGFVRETVDTHECVEFSCETGFFDAVGYRGFYYVENGKPVGWEGVKFYYPTEKRGKGYVHETPGVYYTEKILDNWYYYEMTF